MDTSTVDILRQLNNGFYQSNHDSFSNSRNHSWKGWSRVIRSIPTPPTSVLDVACGNLRFFRFLTDEAGFDNISYRAIDSCDKLVPPDCNASFVKADIIQALADETLHNALGEFPYDLVACFGFMHHVPTYELRFKLVDALLDAAAPAGAVALSFWQFDLDAKTRSKALAITDLACDELGLSLDAGDYLLGWNSLAGTYRYCHSFSHAEIDAMVDHVGNRATLAARFNADGRTGEMNGYLIFILS